MRHARIETPAYHVWVEARPSFNGKGKEAYYEAVKTAARGEIKTPITSSDIEVEIIYSTAVKPEIRLDADNVNKPTLDALSGVAYTDDRQVRHVECTLFDRTTTVGQVSGRVEHIARLFYTPNPHVLLIRIYSDSRLAELGGASVVQQERYEKFEREFNAALQGLQRVAQAADDEFIPSAGVYLEKSSGYYVCPRCRSENKRSFLVNGNQGFSCPVCSGYFRDQSRKEEPQPVYRGPHSWMS